MGGTLGCQSPRRSEKNMRRQHLGSSEVFRRKDDDGVTTMWGVESRGGSGTPKSSRVVAWAAEVDAAKADMDRYSVCCREGQETVFVGGMFDGHGISGQLNWGGALAQSASRKIVEAIAQPFPENAKSETMMRHVFREFQRRHEERYDRDVADKVDDERRKFLEQNNFTPGPRTLPAEGGTTATVCRLLGDSLSVAWVGDSRCVLGSLIAGKPTARALTVDHNITSNPDERRRCEQAGGHVLGRFLGTPDAEGMLQVTRSLGDRAHHANDIVSADPDVVDLTLGPDDRFLLLATDGLWDHLSDLDAVTTVFDNLPRDHHPPHDNNVLLPRLEKAVHNLILATTQRRIASDSKPDDCSVLLLLFHPQQLGSGDTKNCGVAES